MNKQEKLQKLFQEAIELPSELRDQFLIQECGNNKALLEEIRSILHHHQSQSSDRADSPLDLSDLPTVDSAAGEAHLTTGGSPKPHPKNISGYKIVRVLGEGGMGITYEAVQQSPKRRVALKIIRGNRFSKTARRRFKYEADALARLTHSGIAQIFESGVWTDDENIERPFIAMEFVNGGPLTKYVERKELSTIERLELFRLICDAVHHSHQKGVIHRDLKPCNILVRKDGQPKVIDFGVARPTERGVESVTEQTNVGILIGTLQYMSPEQVDATDDDLDTRSDVYSLGVILYELICGDPPYNLRKKAITEAVRIIKEDSPTNPSTIYKSLRGDVETITLKALEKNRNRRYGSAEELGNDIRRYLEDDPIEARPPNLIYRLGKFSRKYRAAAVAATFVFLSIAIGGGVAAVGWKEASFQRARVESRNEVLQESVTSLLTGVKEVVQDLGDSADAQRFLLELAGDNLNAIQQGQRATPMQQIELAALLLRSARSQMSISGVGFGDLEEAEVALAKAEEVLDAIDLTDVEERVVTAASRMKLDRLKYVAEVLESKASQVSLEESRVSLLEEAVDVYKQRIQKGQSYYQTTKDWKGVDVQQSSQLGIGNIYMLLEEPDLAAKAFHAALLHSETLMMLVPEKSTRWQRGISISAYSVARVESSRDPDAAIKQLDTAIGISRSIMTLEDKNARRARDLAFMLALRGQLLIENNIDVAEGVVDLEEAALLFTKRAVQSPQEFATQNDYIENISKMVSTLENAQMHSESNALLLTAISQLECVASAEALAGRGAWSDILKSLQIQYDGIATVSNNGIPND
jgi:serine/threonine protein kinase/tetratricopeptide (TPR) repeat protein